MGKRKKVSEVYTNWIPTDANVQAVADDVTNFAITRDLARELIKSRAEAQRLRMAFKGFPGWDEKNLSARKSWDDLCAALASPTPAP